MPYVIEKKMPKERKPKPGKWLDSTKAFVVHPDIQYALMNYHPDYGFKGVFRDRDKAVEAGEVYWETDHDAEMRETAYERSRRADFKFKY